MSTQSSASVGWPIGRLVRTTLGAFLVYLGVTKAVGSVPSAVPADSLFRGLQSPFVWHAITAVEVGAGSLLLVSGSRLLWRACVLALGVSMILHAVDAFSRGFEARGSGCFGAEKHAAGVDLMRTCLLFLAFFFGYRLQSKPSLRTAQVMSAAILVLLAAYLASPELLHHTKRRPMDAEVPSAPVIVRAPEATSAPVLAARGLPVEGSVQPPAAGKSDAPLVIRVIDPDGRAVADPVITVLGLGGDGAPEGANLAPRPLAVGQDGAVSRDALPTVPFSVQAAHAGFASTSRRFTEPPPEVVELQVDPARTATIRLVTSDGAPVTATVVKLRDVAELAATADGAPSFGPLSATSNTDGIAHFRALRVGASYHVSIAPGQDLAKAFQGGSQYLRAEDDATTVVVRAAYAIWLRAVDEETSQQIGIAIWSSPRARDQSFIATERATGDDRMFGFSAPPPPGDRREILVPFKADPGRTGTSYATYTVSAPGYEQGVVSATLERLSAVIRRGPEEIKLKRLVDQGLLKITAPAGSQAEYALVQVREDQSSPWKATQRLAPARGLTTCSFTLPAGRFRVSAAGNELPDVIEVRALETTTVQLLSDQWAEVRFRVLRSGKPWGDVASLMLATSRGHLLFTRDAIPLVEGLSPVFALPREGRLTVGFTVTGAKPAVQTFTPIAVEGREVKEVTITLPP